MCVDLGGRRIIKKSSTDRGHRYAPRHLATRLHNMTSRIRGQH
eukprot:COSAG02_NODE_68934_length_211_cov_317.946429_1_plen_42_part_10